MKIEADVKVRTSKFKRSQEKEIQNFKTANVDVLGLCMFKLQRLDSAGLMKKMK